MECFCHKLSSQQFHAITEPETAILKTWAAWAEPTRLPSNPAPPDNQVVRTNRKRPISVSTSSARKSKRTLEHPVTTTLPNHQYQDHALQAILPTSSTVSGLVRTYNCQNAVKIFQGGGDEFDKRQTSVDKLPFVRIFIVLERSDRNIEINQLVRRTCCYALALLHQKNTSVDFIVQEIRNALPYVDDNVRDKVYRNIRIGEQWKAIIQDFAIILGRESKCLTGLLCLLESASTWERAKGEDRQSALAVLNRTTDIYPQALKYTPFVGRLLDQFLLEHSFADESRKVRPHLQPLPCAGDMSGSDRCNIDSRAISGLSETSGPVGVFSEEANRLLLLLSSLSTSDKIPLDLFCGAKPRKRWTGLGEIQEVDSVRVGLDSELHDLLSNTPRLTSAFRELESSLAVSKDSDQTYTLNKTVASSVRERLSVEDHSFWKCQALIVAYRAIPWKYIEPATHNPKLILAHLEHTLKALHGCYDALPAHTRADVSFALVEASRFPTMAWKRFAVEQAEIASRGLEDPYLRCYIAQSRAALSRISGNQNEAASSINGFVDGGAIGDMNARMHSVIGLVVIQRALNHIQAEDLSTAARLLRTWRPLGQNPSSLEKVVMFRKNMILGRALRFQGAFKEALEHFEEAQSMSCQCEDLVFDEDLLDLTCERADTLRELDEPVCAEGRLLAEMTRRDRGSVSFGKSRLELCLAEALFAQGRFKDAESLCLTVQSRQGLLKLERLRVYITLAKVRHVNSDHQGAFSYWSEALKEIAKFQLTNGRTTRIIVLSICDTLRGLGHAELLQDSLKQVATLDEVAKPGGVQCWIAGMRHWSEYLQSRGLRSRI